MKPLYAHHVTTIDIAPGVPASATVCLAVGDASQSDFDKSGNPGNVFGFVPLDESARVKEILGVSAEALAEMFAKAPIMRDLLLSIEGSIVAFDAACKASSTTDTGEVWTLLADFRERIGAALGRGGPVDGEPRHRCVLDQPEASVEILADRLTVTVKRADEGVSVYVTGPDGGDITSTWANFSEAEAA